MDKETVLNHIQNLEKMQEYFLLILSGDLEPTEPWLKEGVGYLAKLQLLKLDLKDLELE